MLADGRTAAASVELKALPKSRRVYGYLRHSDGRRTVNRYIGQVTGTTRAEALRDAWRQAREKGLLDSGSPPSAQE
jgi:DNA mismatch endonuclease (patch repair protein)